MREENLLNRLREVVRGEPEQTPDRIESLAVRLGWITPAQLQECIDDPRPPGARLVTRGMIDARRLALLLQLERERPASGPLEMPDEAWSAARDPGNWFGPYLLTGLLGEGAMARVYGAWDRHLCRPVAVKILKEESAGRVERMIREARAAANLSHPNPSTRCARSGQALQRIHPERGAAGAESKDRDGSDSGDDAGGMPP